MSAPFDDDLPDEHAAIGLLLTDALESRAAAVAERAGAWDRFDAEEAASARSGWRRAGVPLMAVAAAVVVLMVVAAALTSGDRVDTRSPLTQPVPTAAPTTVLPVPETAPPATAVAPVESTVPTAPSIRTIDVHNMAYPASLCPDVPQTNGQILLHDGIAGASGERYTAGDLSDSGPGMRVGDLLAYGDVTGDGVDDAVVIPYCYWVPGDAGTQSVAVISMTATGPAVVATLTQAGVSHEVSNEYGTQAVTYSYPFAVHVDGGALVVDWIDVAPGGRYETSVRYRFVGGVFVPVSDTGPRDDRPTSGPRQVRPTGPTKATVQRHDVDSLVVPLSGGRACGPQFADLGPLADSQFEPGQTFYDGVTNQHFDDVITADGKTTDARVVRGSITYKDVTAMDGLNEVEMILNVNCQRGGTYVGYGQVVLRESPAGPEVIGWVFGPSPFAGAIGADVSTVDMNDGDLVIEWYRQSTANVTGLEQVGKQRLRWDGSTFVDVAL